MSTGYLERTGVTAQTEQRSAAEIERYAAHMDFLRWQAATDPDDRPSQSIRAEGWRIRVQTGRCWMVKCRGTLPHPVHL